MDTLHNTDVCVIEEIDMDEVSKLFGREQKFARMDRKNGSPTLYGIVIVDEICARRFLERNFFYNRVPSKKHVDTLSYEFIYEPKFTGETVKFTHDLKLIDGQQRLHAIIKSGTRVELPVIIGVPIDSYSKIDGVRTKTTYEKTNLISLNPEDDEEKIKKDRKLNKMINEIITYELKGTNKHRSLEREVRQYYEQNKKALYETCVMFLNPPQTLDKGINQQCVRACVYEYFSVDEEKARNFFIAVATRGKTLSQEDFSEDNPIVKLYYMLTCQRSKSKRISKSELVKYIYWVIKRHKNGNYQGVGRLGKCNIDRSKSNIKEVIKSW